MDREDEALDLIEDSDGSDYVLKHGRSCWVQVGPWALFIRRASDTEAVVVEAYQNGNELGKTRGALLLVDADLEEETEE